MPLHPKFGFCAFLAKAKALRQHPCAQACTCMQFGSCKSNPCDLNPHFPWSGLAEANEKALGPCTCSGTRIFPIIRAYSPPVSPLCSIALTFIPLPLLLTSSIASSRLPQPSPSQSRPQEWQVLVQEATRNLLLVLCEVRVSPSASYLMFKCLFTCFFDKFIFFGYCFNVYIYVRIMQELV